MALLMWGDLQSEQIGRVTRVRKRLLEVGESYRSFIAAKDWIDQPRQQLKSALGSSIKLRDSLGALESNAKAITRGQDLEQFHTLMTQLSTAIMALITESENKWAEQLDAMGYAD